MCVCACVHVCMLACVCVWVCDHLLSCTQEGHSQQEDKQGLMAEQVRSLVKSTLSGLFRHLSDSFSEEEQHSRPQVLRTVKSGLQVSVIHFVLMRLFCSSRMVKANQNLPVCLLWPYLWCVYFIKTKLLISLFYQNLCLVCVTGT